MTTDAFKEYVLDQLESIAPVSARAMFGGYGLYHDGVFFGIVYRRQLFFKTSEASRPSYLRRGMPPFRPNARQTLTHYYEVPIEIIEDDEQLALWAQQAIEAA